MCSVHVCVCVCTCMHACIPLHISIANIHSQQMNLRTELPVRLGVTPAALVTKTTGEDSEFGTSIAPSESVSAAPGEKHGKKKKKKKKKDKDKGLTE